MSQRANRFDKVRASRDGHEFHEAWATRKALQLLLPTDGLVGIAVESLSPVDSTQASAETTEIADLVLYYGQYPNFDGSDRVVILQLKYSVSAPNKPFRQTDAKKTIRKFADAFRNHLKNHSSADVKKKLNLQLITNRPVYQSLVEAIQGIAAGTGLKGAAKTQAAQFESACGFDGQELREFAAMVQITGFAGSLNTNKQDLNRTLIDWSASSDAISWARLGDLRQLIRDKAGSAGQDDNLITRIDIVAALGLQSADDLFPCPDSFPEVGSVVQREQLREVAQLIPNLNGSLLIHAAGGIGKTVFLQSVSEILRDEHQVVLFDCFGGGAYRAPEDARHLPVRGLVHIINLLACDGLCDPLLPSGSNVAGLLSATRRRLESAAKTLRLGSPNKQLILFIDAMDNAAEFANEKKEPCFPKLLLESFQRGGAIPGVHLVASCRTHRRGISKGDVVCQEIELQPFSMAETSEYLRQRIPEMTQTHLLVATSRSHGNPRILEHLVTGDRSLLDESEINKPIELDDLLEERISKALAAAKRQGYQDAEIKSFLTGLSVLPPPVPLQDLADAHGWDIAAIQSFVADLFPLLELTKHGVMFRDEPTETLVRKNYAGDNEGLREIARNLLRVQNKSVYAARSLPELLQRLDDGQTLFELAFDERFPEAIDSTIGKQSIRYARLKAAVLHSASKKDYDRLVRLLVELSTIAAVNQRGTDYILQNPDLVVAIGDPDATRRLFETRTDWQGTRHARLAIANVFAGELGDAHREARNAADWVQHFYRQNEATQRDRGGPTALDAASVPLYLIVRNSPEDAAHFLNRWKDWFAFEIVQELCSFLEELRSRHSKSIQGFLYTLSVEMGVLVSVLSFLELSKRDRNALVRKLSVACQDKKEIEFPREFYGSQGYKLQDGLLRAAAIAVSNNQRSEVIHILQKFPAKSPSLWSFRDHSFDTSVFSFIAYNGIVAASQQKPVTAKMMLPKDLTDLCPNIPESATTADVRKLINDELEALSNVSAKSDHKSKTLDYDSKAEIDRFLFERLDSLVTLTQAFASAISSPLGESEKPFVALVESWAAIKRKGDRHGLARDQDNLMFGTVGRHLLMLCLWTRTDLREDGVQAFLSELARADIQPAVTLIEIVEILSRRTALQRLAGESAIRAKTFIESDDEVDSRGRLYARLSRAILPASKDEARLYFRTGLEQMDAIGSGDYQFTNELLIFASSITGNELEDKDVHTLTNICELNMPEEEEKFPWTAFGSGLSQVSGLRGLAKLSRWDDRSKISMDYTLLPYLCALIKNRKIDPEVAVPLLCLSDPAEYFGCDSATLATVIHASKPQNEKALIAAVMEQYVVNNPGTVWETTFQTFTSVAAEVFGNDSNEVTNFSRMAVRAEQLRHEGNARMNPRTRMSSVARIGPVGTARGGSSLIRKIAAQTLPTDKESMACAIKKLNDVAGVVRSEYEFLSRVRRKVTFSERSSYLRIVSNLENLSLYTKLNELKTCKDEWSESSAALGEVFKEIAISLILEHAREFVTNGDLSDFNLVEISKLSGSELPVLAIELAAVLAAPDIHASAAAWMGLAAIICKEANSAESSAALTRLLRGGAAKLASSVADGEWQASLYPKAGETEIAAGLVWFRLGSPDASNRWRAAHSVRWFARFGKWEVVDALVSMIDAKDAGSFQAPELRFYFLHARLWLLIALARISIEHPERIAKYASQLKNVAFNDAFPHVLLRHFAYETLRTCVKSGNLHLSEEEQKKIDGANVSPFPPIKGNGTRFYEDPPDAANAHPSKTTPKFYLDIDFEKYDLESLSRVFGKLKVEARDSVARLAHRLDPSVQSMYDDGGRPKRGPYRSSRMNSEHQIYGQQLGWHCLFLLAGEFLATYPVTEDSYSDDPWPEWMGRYFLTRKDGLWLADGADVQPLETQLNLLERKINGHGITGARHKLLELANIQSSIKEELVVEGSWYSHDGIKVDISSALVHSRKARAVALQITTTDPFQVYLPHHDEHGDPRGSRANKKEGDVPWIVCPSVEAKIDGTDPLGSLSAMRRPYFVDEINKLQSLRFMDAFHRRWQTSDGKIVAHSEAWLPHNQNKEQGSHEGERLVCSAEFLKGVLTKTRSDLLLLIKLQKYEPSSRTSGSRFSHTIAVVRVRRSLDFEYFKGIINEPHKTKY